LKKYKGYKIAILVLSIVVIIQTVLLIGLWIRRPKKIPVVPLVIKGKIAIVIDDWGYNLNNLDILEQIKYPLTVSILPNLNYSKVITRQLHHQGFEITLHLPMEPHEKFRLEKNTLMTSMDEPTIKNILRLDLLNVPYALGVSNHMGSKATEDIRTMQIIFAELKKNNLYFLDSLVSGESICFDLANKMHIKFIKRDIFLDNQEDPAYIKGQIDKLKIRAKVYGQAVGIGHNRRITLEVLKEAMPIIEKEGYKFVFVSELVK
jgi:polysaccharide deacetylase 2 family uncharacterized protein YibQ